GLSETLARLPLDDRDVESARRERQRERKARGPRADHGDVEAARAHHRTDTNAATRRMRRRFKTEDTRKSRMVEPQAAARCPSLDAASMTVYRYGDGAGARPTTTLSRRIDSASCVRVAPSAASIARSCARHSARTHARPCQIADRP